MIDPLGLATVFVWAPGQYTSSSGETFDSVGGHASIMTDYGTYVSHHPTKSFPSPFRSSFNTYQKDFDTYGQAPTFVMYVNLPGEQRADEFARQYINEEFFWGLYGNCADAVHSVLNAGGAGLPSMNHGWSNSISYPAELQLILEGAYFLR